MLRATDIIGIMLFFVIVFAIIAAVFVIAN